MSEDIARDREEFASTLSQNDIYKQVVRNAIKLDAPIDMKAEILLSSIPDLAVIYSQLKFNNRIGDLSNDDLAEFLALIIEKIEASSKEVEFNPLKMDDAEKYNKDSS
ncbi:MAG: hypothetical protein GPJ54_22450 [Candidatus Heimdallarchaeota archaeon]|nr:hypothetical protein [Candidatus Heimdallarchaeota archaeon]